MYGTNKCFVTYGTRGTENMIQMNLFMEHKQTRRHRKQSRKTHRHREQSGGCQRWGMGVG